MATLAKSFKYLSFSSDASTSDVNELIRSSKKRLARARKDDSALHVWIMRPPCTHHKGEGI
jgi:hypothetical protein